MSNTRLDVLQIIQEAKEKKNKSLKLSTQKLTEIPLEIFDLEQLEVLDLRNNQIEKIPNEISKLKNLKRIILGRNKIKEIPPDIFLLFQLIEVYFNNNQIEVISPAISNLNLLRKLDLHKNRINIVPEEIGKLHNLTYLALHYNLINYLPDSIGNLVNLEKLDLHNNKIQKIPHSISKLKSLSFLELGKNDLEEIPDEIADIDSLKDLLLYYNNIKKMPERNIKNLSFLNLNGNQLVDIPKGVFTYTSLTTLSLNFNDIKNIPVDIVNLKNLTSLALYNNKLEDLPYVNKLEKLDSLFLDGNHLTKIPDSVTQCKCLVLLSLSGNHIDEIPESLVKLKKLTYLALNDNKIVSIPENIGELTHLSYLNLSKNKIKTIPESIEELKRLENLHLNNNLIKAIPEGIAKLSNLSFLSLTSNELTELPDNIGELKNLLGFVLEKNPITKLPKSTINLSDEISIWFPKSLSSPPYEIAQHGMPAIRKYFEDLESQGEEFIYEAKLVIVGEPWAGKSTLAAKLINPEAELTPYTDETMTRGIDILQWKFPFADNIEFTANIWDFAGQEILQSTHRYFLTKRTLYAIVIDTRPERDVLYDWLQNLKHFADNPPVALILNERDDHRIEIPDSILNAFPFIKKPIYSVNFKTKRGLDDLINGIQKELKTLPHIGKEPIPKNWVKLKTDLEKITTDTISVEDYFSLCANYSEEDARRISHFLHDLGYILHFQKDISLDNTVILNKQWATKAVYLVLDEKNKEKSEKFTVSDIRRIWKDYDKNRYSDLIQLMKNFLICYELNNQEYILPQLLSVNPPENYKWEYTDNLLFEFSYPEFMPKGLLPRFIVKIHKYLYKGIQWKVGVQLCYQNSFAEVIEDYPNRRIKIRIAGKEKVEFLAIIRKEMEELHSFYLNLLVDPMIPCKCDGCKTSNEPQLFPYSVLKEYKKERILKIRCSKYVKQEVEVFELLEGYEIETKEDQFNYPLDKDRNVPGVYFEKIMEGLLKRVYHNASIEPNFKLKDQNGKEFEYDFIVTNSELREIIVVEAKGYHDQKKIPLGSDSEKETIEWFFQKTFRNIKDNYPNPQDYQIKACYITSGFFTDEANAKLGEYNKTKFKSNALDVYYDRDKLFLLLKEKGLEKDIKNIKTHFRKPS
ncbi:MAG: leucine-rich repeat domain-containing protein [Leptospiraceae bacterium]|nr:leucine-rich repeat domain-containing protein [Leptospiraceae bacterium]